MRNANPVQCAEEITRGERTRRGRDERVHLNPATLVTPTVQCLVPIYLTTTKGVRGDEETHDRDT